MPKKRATGTRKGFDELYGHTRDAVRIRCGHDLTHAEFTRMGDAIRAREAQFVLKQTGSRSIFHLEMPFGAVYAVYNRELSLVCTVLEPYMVDALRRQHSPMEA